MEPAKEISIKHSTNQESFGCKWQKPDSKWLTHESEYIGLHRKSKDSIDFRTRRIQNSSCPESINLL